MRVHHINCSTFSPLRLEEHLVAHCLLLETEQGLVLVDSGLGMKDIYKSKERSSLMMRALLRPRLDGDETAVRHVRKLGFKASDVKHIILTHLDFDQVGGVDDFPQAQIHVMAEELQAAKNPKGFISSQRYQADQLLHSEGWNTYRPQGDTWFGFEAVKNLKGLPPEIVLISLKGHTAGHAGVAVNTDQGWLLHAGDAYFHYNEMSQDFSCPKELRAFQKMMDTDHEMRILNQNKLRELALNHKEEVQIFCTHDPFEFTDLAATQNRLLAGTSENFENVVWMRRKTNSSFDQKGRNG